jgi:hypothetical protein
MRNESTLAAIEAELQRNCGDELAAAQAVGVSLKFVYQWRKDDGAVDARLAEAARVGTQGLVRVSRAAALWEPQPGPQSLAVAAHRRMNPVARLYFCTELMFGGARGGGKSDYLLGDFLQDIDIGPEWARYHLPPSYPELEELIKRAKKCTRRTGPSTRSPTRRSCSRAALL